MGGLEQIDAYGLLRSVVVARMKFPLLKALKTWGEIFQANKPLGGFSCLTRRYSVGALPRRSGDFRGTVRQWRNHLADADWSVAFGAARKSHNLGSKANKSNGLRSPAFW